MWIWNISWQSRWAVRILAYFSKISMHTFNSTTLTKLSRLFPSIRFIQDMANFRIDIADLIHAQNAKVLEQQKFAYLKELLTHDTRRLLRCGIQIQLGQQIQIHYTHVLFGWILKLRTLPRMFWNLLRKEGTRSSLRPLETNKLGVLQNVWSDW